MPGRIIWNGEVVGAPYDAGVVGPNILVIEDRVGVVISLGRLRIREINVGLYGAPVDVPLIRADVYPGEMHHGARGPHAHRVLPLTVGGSDNLHCVAAGMGELHGTDWSRLELRRGHPDRPARRGGRPHRFGR